MTFWTLIRRSLRFHTRTHVGVVLGAAIGSAALIGALIVGDSVRASLRERALSRLGGIEFAMNSGDRFFRKSLSNRLQINDIGKVPPFGISTNQFRMMDYAASAVLQLPGTAARQDGRARANQVNVLGIDLMTWSSLASGPQVPISPIGAALHNDNVLSNYGLSREVLVRWEVGDLGLLNDVLARQLDVVEGDEIILRIRKPAQLAQDAVISPREGTSLALKLKVGPILSSSLLGDFGLAANQAASANAFLPLDFLARKVDLEGRANLALLGPILSHRELTGWALRRLKLQEWLSGLWPSSRENGLERRPPNAERIIPNPFSPAATAEALPLLTALVENNWLLEDAQLSVHIVEPPPTASGGEYARPSVELTSSRIFLEPAVAAAALRPRTRLLGQHSGFANDTANDIAFSRFVTNGTSVLTYLANLIRNGDRATPYSMITAAGGAFVPPDMRDGEILINEWLAEDLQAKPGDKIDVTYYAVDSASRLVERTNAFRVRAIVPLKGVYADRTLMPEFPGVAKAESTQDWDTGFPLVYKIREKDEAYWKRYRGTPKAFITFAAGQAMWSSRFGSLTAIRYEVPSNSVAAVCRDLVNATSWRISIPRNSDFASSRCVSKPCEQRINRRILDNYFLGSVFFWSSRRCC